MPDEPLARLSPPLVVDRVYAMKLGWIVLEAATSGADLPCQRPRFQAEARLGSAHNVQANLGVGTVRHLHRTLVGATGIEPVTLRV